MRVTALLILTAGLVACTSGSGPPRQYLLTNVAASDVASPGPTVEEPTLLVGPVELPRYLRRNEIVTREGNRLIASPGNAWGGELEANVTRVLAENLSARMPSDQVWTFRGAGPSRSDYRVSVQVSRFERDADGAVDLLAHWILYGEQNRTLRVDRAAIRQEAAGDHRDYAATVEAMSQALATLSGEIAAAIRAHRAAPPPGGD